MKIIVKDETNEENPPVIMEATQSPSGWNINCTLKSNPDTSIGTVKVDYFDGKLRIFYWLAEGDTFLDEPGQIFLIENVATWQPSPQEEGETL